MSEAKEKIDRLLKATLNTQGSDLFLSEDTQPYVCIDGDLIDLENEPKLSSEEIISIIQELITETHFKELKTKQSIDVDYKVDDVQFRVNITQENDKYSLLCFCVPTAI